MSSTDSWRWAAFERIYSTDQHVPLVLVAVYLAKYALKNTEKRLQWLLSVTISKLEISNSSICLKGKSSSTNNALILNITTIQVQIYQILELGTKITLINLVRIRFIADVPINSSYILGLYSVLLKSLVVWFERILFFIWLKSVEHFVL